MGILAHAEDLAEIGALQTEPVLHQVVSSVSCPEHEDAGKKPPSLSAHSTGNALCALAWPCPWAKPSPSPCAQVPTLNQRTTPPTRPKPADPALRCHHRAATPCSSDPEVPTTGAKMRPVFTQIECQICKVFLQVGVCKLGAPLYCFHSNSFASWPFCVANWALEAVSWGLQICILRGVQFATPGAYNDTCWAPWVGRHKPSHWLASLQRGTPGRRASCHPKTN